MTEAADPDMLLLRIQETIARFHLLRPGERVLAAVSGGLDSMVLLHTLTILGYDVEVAHFDHQTRGGESTNDALFVRNACISLAIPCHCASEPVSAAARTKGVSFESYARERRYAFLAATAEERNIAAIATGHHLGDQAETVLMGLLGLSSTIGPGGIAPVRKCGIKRIVRPLLGCSRALIETWATARGIQWREDTTNTDITFMRNRVRMELLPLLETFQPEVQGRLAAFADIYQEQAAFLEEQARELLRISLQPFKHAPKVPNLNVAPFNAAPAAVRRQAIRLLARQMGTTLTRERCLRAEQFLAEATAGKCLDLGGGVTLCRTREGVHLLTDTYLETPRTIERTLLSVPGGTQIGHYVLQTRVLSRAELPNMPLSDFCTAWRQYFDWDRLGNTVQVRSRKPGDRMIPFGMTHSRKIKDIFGEYGVPGWLRDEIPLVTAAGGILWIAGIRRSALAPVSSSTEQVLEITCRRNSVADG